MQDASRPGVETESLRDQPIGLGHGGRRRNEGPQGDRADEQAGYQRPRKMTPDERAAHRAALKARPKSPEHRAREHRLVMDIALATMDGHQTVDDAPRRLRHAVRRAVMQAEDISGTGPDGLVRYLPSSPPPGAAYIGRQCRYCNAPAEAMDHVWPRSRGGDDHPNNLVPACRDCNSVKGGHSWLTDECPECRAWRDPGDVVTYTGNAFYACRCGASWSRLWDLQHVPMPSRLAKVSGW